MLYWNVLIARERCTFYICIQALTALFIYYIIVYTSVGPTFQNLAVVISVMEHIFTSLTIWSLRLV